MFDYEAYAKYRKGVAQALFADESFRGKSQELLVRVLANYTQALFAQDQIDIARAKKKAFEQQFQQNQHMFHQGEGTRTDILEAESRYELATAEEIEALDEQDASLRELGALIGVQGVNIDDLAPLDQGFQRSPCNRPITTPGMKWRSAITPPWPPSARPWKWRVMKWSATAPGICPKSAPTPGAPEGIGKRQHLQPAL